MMNSGGGRNQEVDLNITPIIDCFTVLITFLLASASFLSIGFFEVYTPGPTKAEQQAAEPDVEVILKVTPDQFIEMKMKGKKNNTAKYALNDPAALVKLQAEIEGIAAEKLTINQVLITASDNVPYQNLVRVMDALQKSAIPVVMGDF